MASINTKEDENS